MFLKFDHKQLEDGHNIVWLVKDGSQMAALQKDVFQKQLSEDIGELSEFCHTGDLEVFHSSLLRLLPKRLSFSYHGTMALIQLAALHHNFNVERKLGTTADGRKR